MNKETFMNIQLFAEDDNIETDDTEITDEEFFDGEYDYYDGDVNYGDDEDEEITETQDKKTDEQAVQAPTQPPELDLEAIRREAYERGLREGKTNGFVGKVNHFTDEPIESRADLEIYEEMLEIEKSGGDPVADYYKHVRDKRRAEFSGAQEREQRAERRRTEIQSFIVSNPDVKVDTLFEDPIFQKVSKGRLGNAPFKEIYADYVETVNMVNKQKQQAVLKNKAKNLATPGALGGGSDRALSEKEIESKYEAMLIGRVD